MRRRGELDLRAECGRGVRGEARQALIARLAALDAEIASGRARGAGRPARATLDRARRPPISAAFRDRMAPDAFARARDRRSIAVSASASGCRLSRFDRVAMLTPGQTLTVTIEKPAAGGRMIARVDGQVVLVAGAIPGERVRPASIASGRAWPTRDTLTVEEPSPDRRAPAADPLCGGCLYAHIAYPRQLEIKSLVIADAFARIGRLPLASPVSVAAVAGGRLPDAGAPPRTAVGGWGSSARGRTSCATPERPAAAAGHLRRPRSSGSALRRLPEARHVEIEIAENLDASERVVHFDAAPGDRCSAAGAVVAGEASPA